MANQEQDTIYLPLENMESEHCAMIIDNGLDKIPGISSHHVEFNNSRVSISSDDLKDEIPVAISAIRDLGYNVPTIKKTIPVINLSCASCAVNVQNILSTQAGVLHDEVNYANAMANIEFVPGPTSLPQLKTAVQSIGYDLMIDETEDAKTELEENQRQKYKNLQNKTFGAIILSVPVVLIGMVFMDIPYANYIMWAFATPVRFIFGRQFFIGAWKQAKHGSANMD